MAIIVVISLLAAIGFLFKACSNITENKSPANPSMLCVAAAVFGLLVLILDAKTQEQDQGQKPISKFCYNGTLYENWSSHLAAQPSVAYLNGEVVKCEGGIN